MRRGHARAVRPPRGFIFGTVRRRRAVSPAARAPKRPAVTFTPCQTKIRVIGSSPTLGLQAQLMQSGLGCQAHFG